MLSLARFVVASPPSRNGNMFPSELASACLRRQISRMPERLHQAAFDAFEIAT